jgi:hypothetical protein
MPAYRIRSVIPLDDLDNEVYQGIWEVEPIGGSDRTGAAVTGHVGR